MKYRAQLAFAVCALAACGKVEDSAESAMGDGGDGGLSSSAGRAAELGGAHAMPHGGAAGGERSTPRGAHAAGGSSGESMAIAAAAGEGGSLAGASAVGGGWAGVENAAGQGGDGGATSGPERVTVDADGLVFVTYTPASDQTRVTVRLDPNCEMYGATVTPSESTCAWIDVTGDVIGDSRVCFSRPAEVPIAGSVPKFYMQSFYLGNPYCGPGAISRTLAGTLYCPELFAPTVGYYAFAPDRWFGNLVCMPVTKLRYVGYTNIIDLDGDLVPDSLDNCPTLQNILLFDTDQDGVGNGCDNCLRAFNPNQLDTDHNGVGDACDNGAGRASGSTDFDGDGISDADDDCPGHFNPEQFDINHNDAGDVCENGGSLRGSHDFDWDGVRDARDNCRALYNPDQLDSNHNGVGDVCEEADGSVRGVRFSGPYYDYDRDGINDAVDNCPTISNSDQLDSNHNGFGDVCEYDYDMDGDGVRDVHDNCPRVPNPDQLDSNHNGVGDACDNGG